MVCLFNSLLCSSVCKMLSVLCCCGVRILFVFHKNKDHYAGAKVRPPRLNGAKLGLFATRSPHRPNPVGLTLAQVEKIEGLLNLMCSDTANGGTWGLGPH